MSNIHCDCKYYVKEDDMCLVFSGLGFSEVSQYDECLEELSDYE